MLAGAVQTQIIHAGTIRILGTVTVLEWIGGVLTVTLVSDTITSLGNWDTRTGAATVHGGAVGIDLTTVGDVAGDHTRAGNTHIDLATHRRTSHIDTEFGRGKTLITSAIGLSTSIHAVDILGGIALQVTVQIPARRTSTIKCVTFSILINILIARRTLGQVLTNVIGIQIPAVDGFKKRRDTLGVHTNQVGRTGKCQTTTTTVVRITGRVGFTTIFVQVVTVLVHTQTGVNITDIGGSGKGGVVQNTVGRGDLGAQLRRAHGQSWWIVVDHTITIVIHAVADFNGGRTRRGRTNCSGGGFTNAHPLTSTGAYTHSARRAQQETATQEILVGRAITVVVQTITLLGGTRENGGIVIVAVTTDGHIPDADGVAGQNEIIIIAEAIRVRIGEPLRTTTHRRVGVVTVLIARHTIGVLVLHDTVAVTIGTGRDQQTTILGDIATVVVGDATSLQDQIGTLAIGLALRYETVVGVGVGTLGVGDTLDSGVTSTATGFSDVRAVQDRGAHLGLKGVALVVVHTAVEFQGVELEFNTVNEDGREHHGGGWRIGGARRELQFEFWGLGVEHTIGVGRGQDGQVNVLRGERRDTIDGDLLMQRRARHGNRFGVGGFNVERGRDLLQGQAQVAGVVRDVPIHFKGDAVDWVAVGRNQIGRIHLQVQVQHVLGAHVGSIQLQAQLIGIGSILGGTRVTNEHIPGSRRSNHSSFIGKEGFGELTAGAIGRFWTSDTAAVAHLWYIEVVLVVQLAPVVGARQAIGTV